MNKIYFALVFLPLLLISCGDKSKSDSMEKSANSKETVNQSDVTPEQCYEAKYNELSKERAKELKEQGEQEPYAEQNLVPQGIRTILMEDCNLK
jgi:hypothetical protein